MTDKTTQADAGQGNMKKDPDDWTTGDEPMTGAQHSYLQTLCEEAKEPFDASLTKAEASKRIDELQRRTGRGKPSEGAGGGNPPADDEHDGRDAREDPAAQTRNREALDVAEDHRTDDMKRGGRGTYP
jgi:hypothetical protein